MFLWLMIAILVAVCSVAGFIYLTRRISAFGFIKKLSKDKKVLKYAISAGLIVLTGGIIWLIWDWINADRKGIRVKATVRNFPNETNMSVITEDGSFYTFNVKYAAEPLLLNVEMCDFIHDGSTVNRPNNAQEIYLKELGSESPMLVRLIMKSIHKQNKREVKHIGCKRFGIQYLLKGIYTHNGLLYFHTEIKNQSNVPFDVDYITWKIVDKKVAKRTAVQEQIILPLRAQNYATLVPGKKSERTVFTMAKFTIPDDKCLVVELNEKNGGRHQSFVIENEDLVRAGTINELQVR